MTANRAIFRELQRQGRSQRWLAGQLGVHETIVSRWKRGLEIPPDKLERICELLSLVLLSPDGDILPHMVRDREPAHAA